MMMMMMMMMMICYDMHSVFRLFLTADYSDGRTNVVLERSNEHWHHTGGPITMDSVYNGETYDARREQSGWDKPKFINQSSWTPVYTTGGPAGKLRAQSMPGMTMPSFDDMHHT
jgi:alpha-L-rhamnosidase